MQEYKPRFSLARRFLLPYTGEDALTRAQAWRLILTWFIFFALVLSLGSLPVGAALTSSTERLVVVFLLTFFGTGTIFALTAGFVVYSLNRTALYRQQWQSQQSQQARRDSALSLSAEQDQPLRQARRDSALSLSAEQDQPLRQARRDSALSLSAEQDQPLQEQNERR
jgi:hypothetical protein